MFGLAKKSKPIAARGSGEIPRLAVHANTPAWRARVLDHLESQGRGAQAELVRRVKEKYPTFSTGQLTDLLAEDEIEGEVRYSRWIPIINGILWPHEAAEIDEELMRAIRAMDREEQRALAKFIQATHKPKGPQ